MDQDPEICQKCGAYQHQCHNCSACGGHVSLGMWPFCRGKQSDHGPTYAKTSGFPFTVDHVDGRPMVIESLQHLRKVESKYGVVFSAFSKANERDLDPIKDLPRYKGDDPGVKRR